MDIDRTWRKLRQSSSVKKRQNDEINQQLNGENKEEEHEYEPV